ncbi:hypothetical protein [Halobaculum rubrum]|uniref:hypothetical protein n=1 Tax=Halobaculum rubrum TaxID=2872158 RepID=UPI001CA3C2CE|nr:hypothetical protein [Halobaculum rubrum]QZX98738.1 hypothetical protein K6T25_10680 [Halobaculum rubrum]
MSEVELWHFLSFLAPAAYVFDCYRHRLPLRVRILLGDVDLEDPWTVEAIKASYVRGRISDAELERRLDLAVDERVPRLRRSLESIGHIGPERSRQVALAGYRSERHLRQASRDDLEAIPDIGEQLAPAIEREVAR